MIKKRLTRDTKAAVLGGVCASLAHYYGQDPVLFRIISIVFLLLTGFFPGVLIYGIAWFIIPPEDSVEYSIIE